MSALLLCANHQDWEIKWNVKKRKILTDATVPMSHVVVKEYAAIV
jgi:hypothetical protein